jgi:hypothetical protein
MRLITTGAWIVMIVGLVASAPAGWAQDGASSVPCSAPEQSQFDFWVGDWKVTDPSGQVHGTNHIGKILGGCVVQENWTGAKGMTGQSYNLYSEDRGVWHQTWVDSNGGLLLLDGGIEDGLMVLRGETPAKDGDGTVQHEISWQLMDSGQVRQIWRMSRDGGETWTDAFVGIYTKHED